MSLATLAIRTRLPLPRFAQTYVVQALCNTFAHAFGVEAPRIGKALPPAGENASARDRLRPDLWAFRTFSTACMEAALESPTYARQCRDALFESARALGSRMRRVFSPRDEELGELLSVLYAKIGIEVEGPLPGPLAFRRCYFSAAYTPALCALMSAFDSGFASGLCDGGYLEFTARITEGAPFCQAKLAGREVGR